jgi:hypothetical protein
MNLSDNTASWIKRGLLGAVRLVYLLAVIAILSFGVGYYIAWSTKTYLYGEFVVTNRFLRLASGHGADQSTGVVGITTPRSYVGVALDADQWDELIAMWKRARQKPSAAGWVTEGSLKERDADNARLFVLSGPTIRLVARQEGNCVSFDLHRSEFDRFEIALTRIRNDLSGSITGTPRDGVREPFATTLKVLTHWPAPPPDSPDCS